jgi:large conductance mechanosensitive channel
MGLLKEFREFAMRGNVVDLAVGVVIGTAFGKIVSSLVGDVVMPVVGKLTGNVDFSKYKIVLTEKAEGQEEVAIGIGTFLNTVIDFIIVAFAIFLVVKLMNEAKKRFEKQKEAAPPSPSEEVKLLTQIRDSLARR